MTFEEQMRAIKSHYNDTVLYSQKGDPFAPNCPMKHPDDTQPDDTPLRVFAPGEFEKENGALADMIGGKEH